MDYPVQVVLSLSGLPEPLEVSPDCGGQAPLTPLTHLPLGAPVGTLVPPQGGLVSASYLVRGSSLSRTGPGSELWWSNLLYWP